jgi:hypothetical protein
MASMPFTAYTTKSEEEGLWCLLRYAMGKWWGSGQCEL